MRMREQLVDLTIEYRRRWKRLCLVDVVYKIISLLLLTPLAAFLARLSLELSGEQLLADQDILFFFIGPAGWLCLIVVGAVASGIVALELAALMAIMRSRPWGRLRVSDAIRFATTHATSILGVTIRIVPLLLLVAAPFLACAGATYALLLSEYDINYYLQQGPPEFWLAVSIGVVIVVALVATLLWLITGWFFALPLVLFEGVGATESLRLSRRKAKGHRRTIVSWIVGWFVVTTLISMIGTALVVAIGQFIVPNAAGSLTLLTMAIGGSLLAMSVVTLAVNVLSMTTFAAILYRLYQQIAADEAVLNAFDVEVEEEQVEGESRFRITARRVLIAAFALTVIASIAGHSVIGSVRVNDDVQVMAHRGASSIAPENTLAAVKKAIEARADWVEIDVQETADGEVVVFHDSDFMKLAGDPLKIWDATADDLARLDIGSWFDPKFHDQRVPTLAKVLAQCRGRIGVNIELKYYGHDQDLERRVVAIVEEQKMVDNVVIMSLKTDAVKKMKSIRPDWKVGLLMSVSAGQLEKIEADFLAVNAAFVDRAFVNRAHRIDKDVMVWTVNDAVTMSTMIGRGVDGLITDEPELARSVLTQRKTMSVTERLLLECADMFGIDPQAGKQ